MSATHPKEKDTRTVLVSISRPESLSARLTKKIARFEQTIAGFRQRRWA